MLKNYKFTVPENTRRDIHTTRKPLFPNWKHKKTQYFSETYKKMQEKLNLPKNLKETLQVQKTFFQAKNF